MKLSFACFCSQICIYCSRTQTHGAARQEGLPLTEMETVEYLFVNQQLCEHQVTVLFVISFSCLFVYGVLNMLKIADNLQATVTSMFG